jgi:hypothetical protein
MSEKWWDMSDDELDDLFREASDKAEIPFDSSALDKLRQKIDLQTQPEPAQKGFDKRWSILALLLLLVGVASLYFFLGKNDDSNPKNIAGTTAQGTSNELNSKESNSPLSQEKNSTNNQPLNADTEKEKNSTNNQPLNADTGKEKNSTNNQPLNAENIVTKKEKSSTNNQPLNTVISTTENRNKEVLSKKLGKPKTDNAKSSRVLSDEIIDEKTASINSVKSSKTEQSKNNLSNPQGSFDKKNEQNLGNLKEREVLNNGLEKTSQTTDNQNISIINNDNNYILSKSKNRNKKQLKSTALPLKNSAENESRIYPEINITIPNPVVIAEPEKLEEKIVKNNFYNVDFLKNKDPKPLSVTVEPESPTYIDAPPIVMKQPKFSRFGVRLAIAPDINSLERLSTSALGNSMGLLFEYRLTKSFILQTGVTFSSKKYLGSFDDYHNWASNWTAYHPSKPVDVNGGCKIIDVPLNIRFNVYQKPRSTFFISTGVSSYFMMNETYTYSYAWSPDKTVNWSDKSSFYWSTINISAGIERKLNKHFTFQIEPYLKTPLSNIGRGGVNLYSSGLLFSTKYEF